MRLTLNSLERVPLDSNMSLSDPLSIEQDSPMALNPLPQLRSRFHVPLLAEKPQNPIMDGLSWINIDHVNVHPAVTPSPIPHELAVVTTDFIAPSFSRADLSLWMDATRHGPPHLVSLIGQLH